VTHSNWLAKYNWFLAIETEAGLPVDAWQRCREGSRKIGECLTEKARSAKLTVQSAGSTSSPFARRRLHHVQV
jgi:hypothetical protein